MKCPFCGCEDFNTIDSRKYETYIRRRKVCQNCKRRYSTVEIAELSPETILVIYRYTDKRKFRKVITAIYLKLFDNEEYLKRLKGMKKNENGSSKTE